MDLGLNVGSVAHDCGCKVDGSNVYNWNLISILIIIIIINIRWEVYKKVKRIYIKR